MASVSKTMSQPLTQSGFRGDSRSGSRGLELVAPIPENPSALSYTSGGTQSQFSFAVDNWIRGPGPGAGPSSAMPTNVQLANEVQSARPPMPPPPVQPIPPRAPPPPSSSDTGVLYTLAMILPLITANNARAWGCSPSNIIHAAQFFSDQIRYLCQGIHRTLQFLAQDRVARDLFATAMDVVLIIYAIGFLVLSMYQASVFN